MRIDLKDEHLISAAEKKKCIDDIGHTVGQQFMDINMILHTSDHWINQVRKDKAHDPSMRIYSNTVSFEGNQPSSTGKILKTEEMTVKHLKECGDWNNHQKECESRFQVAQNWTRLMSLVQIYESWEGDYRHKYLSVLDMAHIDLKNKITNPKLCNTRFGNLRHIRNKFLHNRGVFADDDPDELFEDMTGLFEKDRPMILSAEAHNYFREAILHDIYNFPDHYFLLGEET